MNRLTIVLLYLSILLPSCHVLVEDEFPDFVQSPVLNGLLQTDSVIRVHVSLTAGLADTALVNVSDAQVIIESDAGMRDTLHYAGDGWYASSQIVEAGRIYTCTVNVPNHKTISAQTTIPYPTPIDSVVFTDLAGRGEEAEKISSVEFSIPNNKSQKLFWSVQLVEEGIQSTYDFKENEWTESFGVEIKDIYMLPLQDSVLLHEANPLTIFSNRYMNVTKYKVKFYFNTNVTSFSSSDSVYIVLRSVDESYYRYLKQYYIYVSAGSSAIGFTPQKYPLYSNVKNGLGIFIGESFTKRKLSVTAK